MHADAPGAAVQTHAAPLQRVVDSFRAVTHLFPARSLPPENPAPTVTSPDRAAHRRPIRPTHTPQSRHRQETS